MTLLSCPLKPCFFWGRLEGCGDSIIFFPSLTLRRREGKKIYGFLRREVILVVGKICEAVTKIDREPCDD